MATINPVDWPVEIIAHMALFVEKPANLSLVCKIFHQVVNAADFAMAKLNAVLTEKYGFDAKDLESVFAGCETNEAKINSIAQRLMASESLLPKSKATSHSVITNHLLPAYARDLHERFSKCPNDRSLIARLFNQLNQAFNSQDLLQIELLLQPFLAALRADEESVPLYANIQGASLIQCAARQGLLRAVNQLLACPQLGGGVDGSLSALKIASECGHLAVVNALLAYRVVREKLPGNLGGTLVENLGTALNVASSAGQIGIVGAIIAHERFAEVPNMGTISSLSSSFFSALLNAVNKGHLDVVNLFLAHPRFAELPSHIVRNLLSSAAREGQLQVANALLTHPRAVEILSLNMVLCEVAAGGSHLEKDQCLTRKENFIEIAKSLLADPRTGDLEKALSIALDFCQREIAQLILNHPLLGEQPDQRFHLGNALGRAIDDGYLEIANALFSNPRTENLGKGLVAAASCNALQLLNAILDDPRVEKIPNGDHGFGSALQAASASQKVEPVKALLRHARAKEIPQINLMMAVRNVRRNQEIKDIITPFIHGPAPKKRRLL